MKAWVLFIALMAPAHAVTVCEARTTPVPRNCWELTSGTALRVETKPDVTPDMPAVGQVMCATLRGSGEFRFWSPRKNGQCKIEDAK